MEVYTGRFLGRGELGRSSSLPLSSVRRCRLRILLCPLTCCDLENDYAADSLPGWLCSSL